MKRFKAYLNENYNQHDLEQALLGFAGLPSVASQDRLTRMEGTKIKRITSEANKLLEWYQTRPCLDLTYDLILDDDNFCHGIITNNIAEKLGFQAIVKPLTSEQAIISTALINA